MVKIGALHVKIASIPLFVMPAKAGIQEPPARSSNPWIPACEAVRESMADSQIGQNVIPSLREDAEEAHE
jgi:hypothetical protein